MLNENAKNGPFEGLVGQESVKRTLNVFLGAYKVDGSLPFINLVTQKGGGKTVFARKFREKMIRPDGSTPPMLEVNTATIKNARAFFSQVFPKWVDNGAHLFLDEFHNCPKDLQEIFLTALNIEKSPIRTVHVEVDREVGPQPFEFDFRRLSLCVATTDQQKLKEALRDRLRDVSFEDFTEDQLYKIFLLNLTEGNIKDEAIPEIQSTFRGNARDAVVKAQELSTFLKATSYYGVDKNVWGKFCRQMGVNKMGLNNAEISIIKLLGNRQKCSLNTLAACTGYSRAVIQRDYEYMLLSKGLMEIDGKRALTEKGRQLFLSLIKTN